MSGPGALAADGGCQLAIQNSPGPDWDAYVESSAGASVYQKAGWSLLLRDVLGHSAHFIEARRGTGELAGVLPVVVQRGLLGSFATSMPCFSYGGALCDEDPGLRARMMMAAVALAREHGCSYLELRDRQPAEGNWHTRCDKVGMVLELPRSVEGLSRMLGAKLRSQIRRADREQPTTRSGGAELLDHFYRVFAANMRDLGTPVYPRRFFEAILGRFPGLCRLHVVYRGNQPAAAGFLVTWRDCTEVPWAACLGSAKAVGFNMRLYWELLSSSVAAGSRYFDFGRSTADSGTYRFKQQWGAVPVQLHWHRWERKPRSGSAARGGAEHGKVQRWASAAWQRLPLPVANFLGPLISPGLPW